MIFIESLSRISMYFYINDMSHTLINTRRWTHVWVLDGRQIIG